MIVRAATPQDAGAVTSIYGHAVTHGLGTFEEYPPDAAEMEARRLAVTVRGLPWLVAEADGRVLGYAYAGPFRTRAAYRYTVEDSVYVAADAQGRGAGKALLGAVIEHCEAMGLRQMVAVIGDSGNAASIALHSALGFRHAGIGEALGFKHGRWVDIVWMTRPLGASASARPDAEGLPLDGG